MQPRPLTIITAVGRTETSHVQLQAAASVRALAQRLPTVSMAWVRVLDGDANTLTVLDQPKNLTVLTAPAIHDRTGAPVRLGPNATRNRGLEYASRGWVLNLDSDDILLSTGVSALLVDAEMTKARWAAGLSDDIDGTGKVTTLGKARVDAGRQERGLYRAFLGAHGYVPWNPRAMLVDAALLKDCGGWSGAVPTSAINMACVVNDRAAGLMTSHHVLLYRNRPKPHPDTFGESRQSWDVRALRSV